MIKKLIIILTLLMVVRADAATTVYGPALTGSRRAALTSGINSGFGRHSIKTGMMTNGETILIQFGAYQTTSAWVYDLLTSNNFGTSWSVTTNFMEQPTNLNGTSNALFTFGDSAFSVSSATAGTINALRIAMYNGATQTYLDSQILTTPMKSSGHTAAVVPLGTTRIFGLSIVEGGATDTMHAFYSSGAFSEAVTYTKQESITAGIPGLGLRVPFTWSGGVKGGILYYDQTADDIFWADSNSGMNAALDASWLDYSLPNVGVYERFWIAQIKDSLGMVVWQQDTASNNDNLLYRTFRITGTATGSPAMTTVANGTIENGDGMLSTFYYTPTLSTIWGTDSVICYYKQFEGADRLQPFIAYRIWDGSAWSSEYEYYNPSTPTDTIAYMQAPPRIYNISGTLKQMVCYTDSVGTNNNDTLRIALGTHTLGSTPATPTTNTVIRSAVIRSAVIR